MDDAKITALLTRIADALDRMAPPASISADLDGGDAFVWNADGKRLETVAKVNRVELDLLMHQLDTLSQTQQDPPAMPGFPPVGEPS